MYTVDIDAPEKGIVGRIVVNSEVPAHYPCGPAEAGQNLQVIPGVGWANAIPDGYGLAEFTIRGDEQFRVEGRGYHDHRIRPIRLLGPYALVWLTVLPVSGPESVSAYVVKSSEGSELSESDVIVSQCEGIPIRPYGANSTYPPDLTTGAPTGFDIQVEVPDGVLELKAERVYTQVDFDFYRRFTGGLTGTLNGEALEDGVALWEQFALGEGSD
ncbi:hypothetical protein BJX70DRAFT_400963 [Aspergillus crustosus]